MENTDFILIILLIAVLFSLVYFVFIPQEVSSPDNSLEEVRSRVESFMEARIDRDRDASESFLSEDGKTSYENEGITLIGTSNPRFSGFNLLGVEKSDEGYKAEVKIYESYNEKDVGYFTETLYLSKMEDNYYITSAERGEYTNIENEEANFSEMGNLMKGNPGLKPDTWYLSYEKPGSPGITAELQFNGNVICNIPPQNDCSILQGDELIGKTVRVTGTEDSGIVTVKEITTRIIPEE